MNARKPTSPCLLPCGLPVSSRPRSHYGRHGKAHPSQRLSRPARRTLADDALSFRIGFARADQRDRAGGRGARPARRAGRRAPARLSGARVLVATSGRAARRTRATACSSPTSAASGTPMRPRRSRSTRSTCSLAMCSGCSTMPAPSAATVIGHDWGADVAWKTAWLHPDRIEARRGTVGSVRATIARPAARDHAQPPRRGLLHRVVSGARRRGGGARARRAAHTRHVAGVGCRAGRRTRTRIHRRRRS